VLPRLVKFYFCKNSDDDDDDADDDMFVTTCLFLGILFRSFDEGAENRVQI